MKNLAAILLLSIISFSCSNTIKHIFNDKTPHEKYADKLEDKGLDDTPQGRQWLAASELALQDAQAIQLPYKQLGSFQSDKARALGLVFTAKQGEKLTFSLSKRSSGLALYADLFKKNGTSPIFSADTATSEFSLDIDEAGEYILRLQPELFKSGQYDLSVSVGPSLGFPVTDTKANIGSYWGDNRDGGKRSHEGIDIFAKKGSPAIAAADGYITGVREGGLGGKVVWLRPDNKNYTLYYAHLDQQLVKEGQYVKKGETLGLVGNTGNAKYTPSHLHFGIYTMNGAINPIAFINKTVKKAADIPFKNISGNLRLIKSQKLNDGSLVQANTLLVPLAATSKGYIAELPGGKMIQTSFAAVKTVELTKVNAIASSSLPSNKRS